MTVQHFRYVLWQVLVAVVRLFSIVVRCSMIMMCLQSSSVNMVLGFSHCRPSVAEVMRLLSLIIIIVLQTTFTDCHPVINKTAVPSMAANEIPVYFSEIDMNDTEYGVTNLKLSELSENEVELPLYRKKNSPGTHNYPGDIVFTLPQLNVASSQLAKKRLVGQHESRIKNGIDVENSYVNDCDIRNSKTWRRLQRLPQAIIVGVKKGGTRALLEFLKVHPDVRAPGPEVHFFDRNYHKGLEWYRSRMPSTSPCQVTVEKTPSYFVTRGVASRIHNMSRDLRLIVVVRDPVTRAVSDYVQASVKRPDIGSFELRAFVNLDDNHTIQAADGEAARRETRASTSSRRAVASSWGPIRIGLYARHLRQWLEYFPREQIHFVRGERLVDSPADELRRVEKFLGLRPFVDQRHFFFNSTKGFPCLLLKGDDDVRGVRSSAALTTTKIGTSHGDTTGTGNSAPMTRCLGKNKGRIHPNIDATVLQRLRQFYRPHNELFYRLTGIDFGWL